MNEPTTCSALQSLLSQWPRRWVSEVLFSFVEPDSALLAGLVAERLQDCFQDKRRRDLYILLGAPCIDYFHASYPELLRQIPDPPLILYYRGNLQLLPDLEQRCGIAIVGARRATRNGRALAEQLAADLSRAGLVVVSGLAYGIDSAAHTGTLAVQGATIAVLGNGLNRVYPQRHTALARQIVADRGLLLSEYPPAMPPLAHHFPERNRIISGLSTGVVVVEAGLRSGSLITARLALEQGRDVFAVPGSVSSLVSRGCHQLIRQGAELVCQVEEILTSLGIQPSVTSIPEPVELTQDQRYLLGLMPGDAVTLDELLALTAWSIAKLSGVLAEMALAGIVRVDADGYIATSKIDC